MGKGLGIRRRELPKDRVGWKEDEHRDVSTREGESLIVKLCRLAVAQTGQVREKK